MKNLTKKKKKQKEKSKNKVAQCCAKVSKNIAGCHD